MTGRLLHVMLGAAVIVGASILVQPAGVDGSERGGQVPQAGSQNARAPQLTRQHTGWRKTGCLECHDRTDLGARHKDAATFGPADCGPCHGDNGAPQEAHAISFNPCASCHARVEHASAFKAPGECIKCHKAGSRD